MKKLYEIKPLEWRVTDTGVHVARIGEYYFEIKMHYSNRWARAYASISGTNITLGERQTVEGCMSICDEFYYSRIQIYFNELPSPDRWIPVEERLPEKSDKYMVKIDVLYANRRTLEVEKLDIQAISCAMYDIEIDDFDLAMCTAERDCEYVFEITHWKPIKD